MQQIHQSLRGVLFLALITATACMDGSSRPSEANSAQDVPLTRQPVTGGQAENTAGSPGRPDRATSSLAGSSQVASGLKWRSHLLATLPVGEGPAALGIFPGAREERARGPRAFAVAPDGRIVLSDNEHSRLVTLAEDGRWLGAVDLPDARFISALEALEADRLAAYQSHDDALLVLDSSGRIESRTPATGSMQPFGGLFGVDGRRLTYRAGNAFFSLDAAGLRRGELDPASLPRAHSRALADGRFVATRRTSDGPLELVVRSGAGEQGSSRRIELEAPVAGRLGSATVLASDEQGRLFVRLEVLNGSSPIHVRRFVAVYDAALKPIDTFEYPLEHVILPEDDVQIDGRGRVYVLLPYPDRVELLRFEP